MSINKRLSDLLGRARVSYEVYNQPVAFTAQKVAQLQHSGNRMAKVVILKVDGKLAMGVVTGSQRIDFAAACSALGAREVRLAGEEDFTSTFPDCEMGAIPPFGNLVGLPVYVDPAVAKDETIVFKAGNHAQTVCICYKDYERLVTPRVVRLTEKKKKKHAA
jgi:Ala-tRNA(Pro) deacylase